MENIIKGIIFDMDGVISDTQKLHSQVESRLLKRYGIEISPDEITSKYSGVRTKDFFNDLLQKQMKEYDLDVLMKEKWLKMEELASKSVDCIDGSINLIKRLHQNGYKLAVASASNFKYVQEVLKTLQVLDYFSYVVSGDMVTKGKPDPESFLLAAEKIKIPAQNCLVIEDGMSGMEAARRAGIKCVGLVSDINKTYPTKNLIESLFEITNDYIRNLK